MNYHVKSILLSVVIIFGFSNGYATPSTQIWIPSTDVQGFGVIHLGWDSYIKTESHAGIYEPTCTNGGITAGILPFKKVGLEIGIDYRDMSAVHQYPVYFNAKLGVPEDAFFKYMPAIAVGGFDFGTQKDYDTYDIAYGLLAKNIWKLGRISAGYYFGNDKLLVNMSKLDNTGNPEKDKSGLLLSWDRTMTEISDKLWLAVDYMGAKNSYGAVSFGLSYAIVPDASFIIGYDIWNDNSTYKPTVTVQIDMNLPAVQTWFKKEEKK
jgi:hypothetical protein